MNQQDPPPGGRPVTAARLARERHPLYPKQCHFGDCCRLIFSTDENWVRLDVMHHDRPGVSNVTFCTPAHAGAYLATIPADDLDGRGVYYYAQSPDDH